MNNPEIKNLREPELIYNQLKKNNYQIISTGHSLGGAMAQCFMYFALTKGKITKKNNLPITITYGQPKAGNIYLLIFWILMHF